MNLVIFIFPVMKIFEEKKLKENFNENLIL